MRFLGKVKNKFMYAMQGIVDGMKNDDSIQRQWMLGLLVLILGIFVFHFSIIQWIIALFAIALVIGFEYVNSAIETITDHLFPQYDERAKKIKDYAAGAVLIVSLFSLLIAIIMIFLLE